jgi:hypothetical protein
MYVLHPHSRLTSFYAVYVEHQWRLNSKNLTYIAQVCSNYLPSSPIDLHLATVDRYVNEQVAVNQHLTNIVVTELYQKFSTVGGKPAPTENRNHQIWINFIHYMSEKLIANVWNRLPEYKRVEETLDLLRNATLVEPEKLFHGFDPLFDRDLLNGIERWTYRFLRNSMFSQIRVREQFFGLSNLGVVSKSTKFSIRKLLSSQTLNNLEGLCNHNLKDRSSVDLLLVNIYKSYLNRTQIRTDRLVARDWQQIELEVQKQWSNLELDLPPPSIEKIQAELKLIGGYIRKAASISIQSLDAGNIPSASIAQRSSYSQAYSQLLAIVGETIATLDPRNIRLLELYYRDGLTQKEISLIIERDQTVISKNLTQIERAILRNIHKQLCLDDVDTPVKIDRTSIRAMKDALKDFYSESAIILHT